MDGSATVCNGVAGLDENPGPTSSRRIHHHWLRDVRDVSTIKRLPLPLLARSRSHVLRRHVPRGLGGGITPRGGHAERDLWRRHGAVLG
jgi:hypothetical protein